MKKILVLVIILSVMISIPAMASINDGLVAYYPFNSNANDESGNENNCTVYGPMLSIDRFGNSNSAYIFDGYDDYIEIDNSANFPITQSLSISVWIKPTNPNKTNAGSIVTKYGDEQAPYPFKNQRTFGLFHSYSDEIGSRYLYLTLSNDGETTNGTVTLTPVINLDEWQHVVATWNGQETKLFLNSVLVSHGVFTGTLHNSPCNVRIGFTQRLFAGQFEGSIDDIRLYERAVTKEEVKELYMENQNVKAVVYINPGTLNLKSNGNYVTSYIELPEDYSVLYIDVSSVIIDKINGEELFPPLYAVGSSEIGDYDENDIPDLSVKFDRQELILSLTPGDAELNISGVLTDGTSFRGSNSIRVISKGKK